MPCDNQGMAATVEEGTAPKLEAGKCVALVGETIASRTGKPGNTPTRGTGHDRRGEVTASSDSPFTKPARFRVWGTISENAKDQATAK